MGKSASSFLLQRRASTLIVKIWTQRTYYVLRPVPSMMMMMMMMKFQSSRGQPHDRPMSALGGLCL